MWSPDVYEATIDFAAAAHEGQYIPGKTYSYVVHLANVCMEVQIAMTSEPLDNPDLAVQCALLHDTIEDTTVTYDILLDRFGEEVADGVLALTKNPKMPRDKAIADSVRRVKERDRVIWMVKLADRVVNLHNQPPSHWDDQQRREYLDESRLILDELKSGSPHLAGRLEQKISAYTKFVG